MVIPEEAGRVMAKSCQHNENDQQSMVGRAEAEIGNTKT